MTILSDMDDVLEQLVKRWIAVLNKEYRTNVSEEEVNDWHIAKFFPALTEKQIFEPLSNPDFWPEVEPMPHAQRVVQRLIDDGHTFRVVTSSRYDTVAPKMKLLLSLYPYLHWQDVIISSDKKLISGDVLIDDGTHNLIDFPAKRILFDRPHNRNFPEKDYGMIRAYTWDDVYNIINSY